jgi:hypothetical protein
MIATSPDGQWAAVRRRREVSLFAGGAGPATARIELATEDADLVIVGPPSVLAIVTRGTAPDGASLNCMVLHQPPYLDAVARLEFEAPMRIAAVTGPRIVLVSGDGKAVTIVRVAGRALSAQALDPGSPVEFAVGLERNQVLFGLHRKLEAWDAISARPLLRMQLQLPPPPRIVGPAHGHLWAIRPGGDSIMVCRLSDGRQFRHPIGVPIDEVVYHPASPLVILVTAQGLVRLHCFAHSLTVIDAPWQPEVPLGQLVVGEDISLLGMAEHDDEPWRVPIGGAGAPAITLESPDAPREPLLTAADKLRAMRERSVGGPTEPGPPPGKDRPSSDAIEPGPPHDVHDPARPSPAASAGRHDGHRDAAPVSAPAPPPAAPRPGEPARARTWRDPLATLGADLARGTDAEVPVVADDTELGQLAHRLALPAAARRALIVLYGLHLVGEPGVAIARLARATGDWTEALGQGELGMLAMLRRRGGKVGLRSAVTDLLDGVSPRAIRVIGGTVTTARPGATRLPRDGRSDAELEAELATLLGRIAVIEGGAALGLLEARLHGATALALTPPEARPVPWPRDAGLVVIADPGAPAWVAALASFTAA